MAISFGPLSTHMAQHLLLMNVTVPLLVLLVSSNWHSPDIWRSWPWATLLQLVLLWGWHVPSVLTQAVTSPFAMMLMHLSLAGAAAWFWFAVATIPSDGTWRAIFALLVTGKLFCLLGALLVFAPNTLFDFAASGHGHHAGSLADGLADQQSAGMMMLIACPLTYVGAGVFIASRWFLSLERDYQANA